MEGFHLIELPKSRTLTVTLLLDNFYKKGIIMEFQRKKDSHNSAVLVKLSFRYKDPVVFNKCLHSQAFNSEYYPNGAYPNLVLFQSLLPNQFHETNGIIMKFLQFKTRRIIPIS